jgi:hypothetical protein
MADWSRTLHERLEALEPNLANAAGFGADITGVQFEESLGALLRWQELRHLNERFKGLGGNAVGSVFGEVDAAIANERRRIDRIMQTINETLYEEFGAHRIDDAGATDAYAALLETMPEVDTLTVVRTNYDPSVEIALASLGWVPETGFERRPGRAPVLRPEGLFQKQIRVARGVPVLHLHGAVGWYERDGMVLEHHQDQPFNPSLGRPVVLYPDPNKDPTRDALVQALWHECDEALTEANRVLVVGHSLHDPALVSRLIGAAQVKPVGITTRASNDPMSGERAVADEHEITRILELVPGNSNALPVHFGPKGARDLRELTVWQTSNPS